MFELTTKQIDFLKQLNEALSNTISKVYLQNSFAEMGALTYDFSGSDDYADMITNIVVAYGVYNPEDESLNFRSTVELPYEEWMNIEFISGIFYRHLLEE